MLTKDDTHVVTSEASRPDLIMLCEEFRSSRRDDNEGPANPSGGFLCIVLKLVAT